MITAHGVRPVVRLGARGEPALPLLHEPLQRCLPRHRQVRRGGKLAARTGRLRSSLGEAQQGCRLVGRALVEHQHPPAVENGQLRRPALQPRLALVLLPPVGDDDVGARHEGERPHGRGRPRVMHHVVGRPHVLAERAARRRKPAAGRVARARSCRRRHVSPAMSCKLLRPRTPCDWLRGGGGAVEMEVIPMGQDISNAYENPLPMIVDEAMLEKVLGPPRFDDTEAADRVATPGVSVGLVWTSFGGEVQFVEATTMVGKGDLHLTGQLGDVIKESAQLALTWVRARAADLNLSPTSDINLLESRDVHIHFPAGAVPKDGPSAGVTLVTSLVSLFSHCKVRADTAMTGEMTLRGLVLPVGGVKDKVLAAHRYGIKRVILPERNLKDLSEVPAPILSGMEILLVKRIEEVLDHALEGGCPLRPHSKL